MTEPARQNSPHMRIIKLALFVCAGAFLFGFGMVPIYRIACQHIFGIKLAESASSQNKVSAFQEDSSRLINVQFVANVNSKLPWGFKPEVTSMQIHPGKLSEAWFDAVNNADSAIVGNAVPSVAPSSASLYFNKTECFCFTQQLLKPGESRRMPVKFIVDPELPENITTLTLSYTFYANDIATKDAITMK